MACFLVPTAEAIAVSVIKHKTDNNSSALASHTDTLEENSAKISWKQKLSWLNCMLWGGSLLLCLEHIWHGEVVLYPPFLTAMANSADTTAMLHEMATAGVAMAALITLVWAVMVVVADNVPAIKQALGAHTLVKQ